MKNATKPSVKKSIMQFDLNAKKRNVQPINQKTNTEKRAVIYCRVSDMKQATQGFWLEGQERACRDRCQYQPEPIAIDKVFIEPWMSGAITNRKEFNNCLAYLEEQNKKYQKITHFVVSEASRISRPDDIAEAFMMEEAIKSTGVKIISLDMPGIDESTDEGHLFKTLTYAIAWYERKKIKKRVYNGKISRLKNGFRPFSYVPVWYIRVREWPKSYYDAIDEVKWPLVKQGLELFARNVIITQADLRRFRDKKGLRTNVKNAIKLHKTFPEKQLQLHRLFYYAWHIYYPERGVNEPFPAKHEGLISLRTVYAIIEKVQKLHKWTKAPKIKTSKMTDADPLRGVVICPYCDRRFTSRNTNKYRMKGGERIKKVYPYYGCANPHCDNRVNIWKQVLEWAFESILDGMSLSKEMTKTISLIFSNTWQKSLKTMAFSISDQKKNMKWIEKRQEQIEGLLLRTSNTKLCEKLEIERWSLESEKARISEALENKSSSEEKHQRLLKTVLELFRRPKELRKNGSSYIRQLLIKVRFWDHLYYTKEDWLQTTENALLYQLMMNFNSISSSIRREGDKLRTFDPRSFEQFTTCIENNSTYINAISYRLENGTDEDWDENETSKQSLEPP